MRTERGRSFRPRHRKPTSNPAQIRAEALDGSETVTLPSLLSLDVDRGVR